MTLSPSDLDRVEALAKAATPDADGKSGNGLFHDQRATRDEIAFLERLPTVLALIAYVREMETVEPKLASLRCALAEQTAQCERLTKLLNDSLEYTLAQKSAECERLTGDLQNSRNATSNEIYVRVDIERDLAATRSQLSLANASIGELEKAARGLFEGGFIDAGTRDQHENQWAQELDTRLAPLRVLLAKPNIETVIEVTNRIVRTHPDKVKQARANPYLSGWFIGYIMKEGDGLFIEAEIWEALRPHSIFAPIISASKPNEER
jgi:hypothetical protein